MWPFKKKKVVKIPEAGDIYCLDHEDPFATDRVRILEVRLNGKGKYWVRYAHLSRSSGDPLWESCKDLDMFNLCYYKESK